MDGIVEYKSGILRLDSATFSPWDDSDESEAERRRLGAYGNRPVSCELQNTVLIRSQEGEVKGRTSRRSCLSYKRSS